MQEFAQAPCTLIFDDIVRVYFSCRPPRDQNGQYVSYTSFVDLDRRNLNKIVNIHTRPVIELGGLGTFDEFGIYPASVIREGVNLMAYYAGWTRCESVPFNVAIGLAISKDNGVSFSKLGEGPILSYTVNEPFVLSGPKIRRFEDVYYLFYIAGTKWIANNGSPEPVYKIRMAKSLNGYDWTRMEKNLIEDRIEENEAQASPDVIFSNGLYHMFFCYRYSLNYRGKEFGYRIGYASSKDLIHWERDDSKAGLEISEEGWDSEMVAYPHVFELDGKINMFYLGNQVGRYGFGLAELQGAL